MLLHKIGQRLQRGTVVNGGGGVVGVGQQHHAGAGSIFGFQLCAAQLITVRSIQFHGDRHAAHDLYVQKVVGVAGRGNQHFIALTHKRQDRKVQAGVRTGRDQDVALRIHSQTVLLLQLFWPVRLSVPGRRSARCSAVRSRRALRPARQLLPVPAANDPA